MDKLREKVAKAVEKAMEKNNNNVHPKAKVLMLRWSAELDAGTRARNADSATRFGCMLVLAMCELSQAYHMIDKLEGARDGR